MAAANCTGFKYGKAVKVYTRQCHSDMSIVVSLSFIIAQHDWYALGEPILCDMNWESTGVLHGRLVAGREVNRVDYFCSCRRAVLRAC